MRDYIRVGGIILRLILGLILMLAGIGSILGLVVAFGWPDSPGPLYMAIVSIFWGGVALLAFTGAITLFIKAHRRRK
jgi:uncharacterized membrane protein YphA (DoxX/SURF4 family)